jgi:hypothetical protein
VEETLHLLQAQSLPSSRRPMGYQEQDSDGEVGTTDGCAFYTYFTGKTIKGNSNT